MSTTSPSVSIGAIAEVDLIDRFQQQHNGALRHFVFKGGNAKTTLAAIRLLYIVSAHRRCPVTSRFEPVNQPAQILLQIASISLAGLTINPDCTILARAVV